MARYILEVTDANDRRKDIASIESDAPFQTPQKGQSISVQGEWVTVKEVQFVFSDDGEQVVNTMRVFGSRTHR